MTGTRNRPRGEPGAAHNGQLRRRPGPTVAPADDVYAWTGLHLNDGRIISIAWLRNYPGATMAWRRSA